MEPYLEFIKAVIQDHDPAPELEAIRTLPLEKRYVWRIASALKLGWVDRVQTVRGTDNIFVSGNRWEYDVVLRSNSAQIAAKTSHNIFPSSETESINVAWLSYNDESLARRVAEALHHASDLCRKKEAF